MPNISFTIEKDGAEKLWNYILAYKERMRRGHKIQEEAPSGNNITFMVPPVQEQTVTCLVNRRKLKSKHS